MLFFIIYKNATMPYKFFKICDDKIIYVQCCCPIWMNISAFPFGWQNLCLMKINIKLLPNDHNAAMKRVFSCGPQYMALFHSVFGGGVLRIKSYKNIIMNVYRIHVEYCIFSLNSPLSLAFSIKSLKSI